MRTLVRPFGLVMALCGACEAQDRFEDEAAVERSSLLSGDAASRLRLGDSGSEFTAAHVEAIVRELRRADPSQYYLKLPEFRGTRLVGQQTYGELPMADIRRVASSRGVTLDPDANMLAVFAPCSGGGAGSHTPSQSAGLGIDLDEIVSNVDASRYQYLY